MIELPILWRFSGSRFDRGSVLVHVGPCTPVAIEGINYDGCEEQYRRSLVAGEAPDLSPADAKAAGAKTIITIGGRGWVSPLSAAEALDLLGPELAGGCPTCRDLAAAAR